MLEPQGHRAQGRIVGVNHTGRVSGAETVMLRFLARAAERGWATVVAAPEGPIQDVAERMGNEWLPLPDLTRPLGNPAVAAARLAARNLGAAQRLRRAGGFDIAVASGMRVLPVITAARLPAKVVWLAQSVVDRRRWSVLVRCCARRIDLAVAVSGAVAESIGPSRFPIKVVWNGTQWPVEPAPPVPPEPPVVGCLAVLTPWKGQNVLLEAVAAMPRKDVSVELAGQTLPNDGAYEQALRHRATEPDLAGRVRFLGHVDDSLARLRTWSVEVVASVDAEAGPLAALEAMSVGIPVVATDHGGVREVIGDAGILVPPRDPHAMAAAIEMLISDHALRRRCAEAGREIIASGHRLDRQIDALVDAAESVLTPAASDG